MNVELRKDLVGLFRETGRAHHAAFAATDGADPEWPIWYAQHLQAPIADALGTPFTQSQLVYCVMDADFEQAGVLPELWTNAMLGFPQSEENRGEEESLQRRTDCIDIARS